MEGGLGDKEGEREEGLFCEIQISGVNIDPWQKARTNHYGLICELRKQRLPRGCRLLNKPPQSNLVSSLDRLLGWLISGSDQWVSARHLTESLRIFLWTRRRNGGGTRGQLSEFVTG